MSDTNSKNLSGKQEIIKPDTGISIAGIKFKNPVMAASGTFGSGMEYCDLVDLNRIGAVVTKGVAIDPWEGNPTPRVCETPSGMLNAIGLQNPGVEVFCERDLPFLRRFDTRVIVNICGRTKEEYVAIARRLADEDGIDMLEINISCPNVSCGGISFGTDPILVEKMTSDIKKQAGRPVAVKLTPNVTDITDIARAAEAGGADAVSLINTLTGMKIDIEKRRFALANKTGGLSGPAIHPVAVRMVYQVARAISVPIIGMGGIASATDAIEMLMAGATAVCVGTYNFRNPKIMENVIEGIEDYMKRHGMGHVSEITLGSDC